MEQRHAGPSQDLRSADNISPLLGVVSINLSLISVAEANMIRRKALLAMGLMAVGAFGLAGR